MLRKSILLIVLFTGITLFGQSHKLPEYLPANASLMIRVKQFNQFVNRFNYTEDFEGNPVDTAFSKNMPREKYIGYLFNQSDNRLTGISVNDDYKNRVRSFIQDVINNTETISITSENIFVLAHCKVKYKNQDAVLDLVLRRRKVNNGLAWVIYTLQNDIFDKTENPTDHFIPPTSNELNFTHLKRAFSDNENIEDYFDSNYQDVLLVKLKNAVKNNELEFFHVEKMSYFVFDIDGWLMVVEEFNRNLENSGWLISDISVWNKNPSDFFKQK